MTPAPRPPKRPAPAEDLGVELVVIPPRNDEERRAVAEARARVVEMLRRLLR